jgi:hypothetical protein
MNVSCTTSSAFTVPHEDGGEPVDRRPVGLEQIAASEVPCIARPKV